MKKNFNHYINIIFAVFIITFGVFMGITTHAISNISDLTDYVFGYTNNTSIKEVRENINSSIPCRNALIDFSGIFMNITGTRDYYDSEYGINITDNGYVISRIDRTSCDYETEQMIMLKHYLDERSINLLYVNEPAKYIDDTIFRDQFYKESYLNRNMDVFLDRMKKAKIDCLDLRETIRKENLDCYSLFYRGDHHWTVPCSKWAALQIAKKLNNDFGYHISLEKYDDDMFEYCFFKECWLGEQGRLLGEHYIGLDDFTLIKPIYPTSFTREWNNTTTSGSFDIFIDYSSYEDGTDANGDFMPAKLNGWHYSYQDEGRIHNNDVSSGKILVLGDSYDRTLLPFLALGVNEIYEIQPRYMAPNQVLEEINSGNYDTVIVSYAQFMLGSHDNPNNANYRQFSFFD